MCMSLSSACYQSPESTFLLEPQSGVGLLRLHHGGEVRRQAAVCGLTTSEKNKSKTNPQQLEHKSSQRSGQELGKHQDSGAIAVWQTGAVDPEPHNSSSDAAWFSKWMESRFYRSCRNSCSQVGPMCVCVFRMLQHTHRREHKHTHLSSSQCLLEYIPLGIEGGGVGGVGGLKLLPAALALIPPGKVQSLP